MKLQHFHHHAPTISFIKRANGATKPTATTPKPKEQHEIVKFILKYANIVWAYLKTLPSNYTFVFLCFYTVNDMIIISIITYYHLNHQLLSPQSSPIITTIINYYLHNHHLLSPQSSTIITSIITYYPHNHHLLSPQSSTIITTIITYDHHNHQLLSP